MLGLLKLNWTIVSGEYGNFLSEVKRLVAANGRV